MAFGGCTPSLAKDFNFYFLLTIFSPFCWTLNKVWLLNPTASRLGRPYGSHTSAVKSPPGCAPMPKQHIFGGLQESPRVSRLGGGVVHPQHSAWAATPGCGKNPIWRLGQV